MSRRAVGAVCGACGLALHCVGGAGGVGVGVEGEDYVVAFFVCSLWGLRGGTLQQALLWPCWGSIVVVLFLRGMVVILGGGDDGGFGDVRGRRALGKGLYNTGWEKLKSFFAL